MYKIDLLTRKNFRQPEKKSQFMLEVFVGRMKREPLFMPFDLHEVMAFTTYSVFELNCPLECLHELYIGAPNNNVGLCFYSTQVRVYHYFVHLPYYCV